MSYEEWVDAWKLARHLEAVMLLDYLMLQWYLKKQDEILDALIKPGADEEKLYEELHIVRDELDERGYYLS